MAPKHDICKRRCRCNRRGSAAHFKSLLASTCVYTAAVSTTATTAFSPEIFNQVILQLGSITAEQIQGSADELAFAAANLLDTSSPKRRTIPLIMSSPSSSKKSKSGAGGSISLPKLAPSIYDYEVQEDSQSQQQSVTGKLDLTLQEEELIQLILAVRNKYSPRTTIRIAGGWVRDKLIYGKDTPSRDIDLVLSDIPGKEFAEHVCNYVEEANGIQQDDENDNENAKRFQIERQSTNKGEAANKLQSASLLINGFEVDFCRLRYEKYNKDSRIPSKIGIASVVEDAWRRDLTINALYYNINSNQVEDYTERGIRDLILQTIATPLKPLPTLLQDPTRILRAIRFAAQLSFDISADLIWAARDARVRSALKNKVSRDAIGQAMDDIFGTRARDPVRGIQLLITTNLIDVIFPLGKQYDPTIYRVGLEYLSRVQSLVTRIFVASPDLDWDITKRRLLWYAAFLKPVYELALTCGSNSKRGRRQESAFYQLLDALKRPKTDVQSIESILKGVNPIIQTIIHDDKNHDAIHFALRSVTRLEDVSPATAQWDELSELRWVLYSTLQPIGAWKESAVLALASSEKNIMDSVNFYKELISLVDILHLDTVLLDKPKPLLNGSQIQQRVFQGQINGQDFKRIMQAMEEWQIRNDIFIDNETIDDESRKHNMETELIDYLRTNFPEYTNKNIVQ